MTTKMIEEVKTYAKKFAATMIREEELFDEFLWNCEGVLDYDEDEEKLISIVELELVYDYDTFSVSYAITRDNRCRYSYDVTFELDDELINDSKSKEFEEIISIINMCEDNLFSKICSYLHKHAMEQIENDDEVAPWRLPKYKEYYSPSKIASFMKKYGVSQFVPIDVEVVDEKGDPIKYLSIKNVGFNDEGNRLIVMMSED